MTSTSRVIEYASGGGYAYELVDAAETCAWWLTGKRKHLTDEEYGEVQPLDWLWSQWWIWCVERYWRELVAVSRKHGL